MGFPGGSAGNESTCNVEDLGSIPGLGRSPGEGNSYALRDSGLENPMDWYSPWGHKELDTTERLSLPQMYMASQVAQLVTNPPAMWKTWVRSLDWEDSLEGKG